MNNKTKDCIKCNLCKKHCEFLNKYDMDLDVFSKREDLAYNCFLCGRCKEVCPKDIDGKTIALDMRQSKIKKYNLKGGIAMRNKADRSHVIQFAYLLLPRF